MLLGVVDQGGKFGLSACNLKGFFLIKNYKIGHWLIRAIVCKRLNFEGLVTLLCLLPRVGIVSSVSGD